MPGNSCATAHNKTCRCKRTLFESGKTVVTLPTAMFPGCGFGYTSVKFEKHVCIRDSVDNNRAPFLLVMDTCPKLRTRDHLGNAPVGSKPFSRQSTKYTSVFVPGIDLFLRQICRQGDPPPDFLSTLIATSCLFFLKQQPNELKAFSVNESHTFWMSVKWKETTHPCRARVPLQAMRASTNPICYHRHLPPLTPSLNRL